MLLRSFEFTARRPPGGAVLFGWPHTVLHFHVFLARYRAPPVSGQAHYSFWKTSGTRRQHPGPGPTPGWPLRPLQKYEAARRRTNPNAPRLHLHDAESRPALDTNDNLRPFGSWNTVSANRKPASTARPRSELITVGIQLPPGTLTPKLPLYDLLSTITATANLSPKTSVEVTLQAKPAQSLVFLKTHSPLTAHLLLSLTSLELNGKPITIKPYALSPPILCLGVIHNVGGHFTTSQLLHDLQSFTSDILAARMMGSTESVLITFAGTIIPRFVYFKRVSFRCRPHKPKPPTCTRCLAIGHRAHQCPQHSVPAKCRRCASPLLADPDAHVCAQPWCIHCQVNTLSSLDSTCPYILAKQRDCAKAAFLRRTAIRQATQPSPPSSSAHEPLSPPATSPPGSYATKVKGTPPMCTSSSNTHSPSSSNESRSFDLRLAMLERNQREQQRVSDELQQKILALTQTLATTTSSLTSQLTELNKQLTTLTAPTSSSHVTKLADMVETTTTAHHTRLVQLENSIARILTTLETQPKQLESFTYMLNSLQESLTRQKRRNAHA
ncbi:hypothetical protein HPB51_006070 [Rhipicephalus microplus]|uniref:CCHC-type domain-containing protein n=1 Tax=Rhipicephalus microplus TaxID=6941 RepID=A0A9J6ERK8_RHIMP|nr:hypothetical protein HPB51_006070 [Rhipicephalus microplus]